MPKLSPIAVYFILAVIVGFFYGNTLRNGFVHDDVWQIVNNSQIKSVDFGKIFGGCVAQELLGGCERGFYWRPIAVFINATLYQVSQSAAFFHLMNLVYFWVAGILVYLVVGEIVARGPAARHPRPTSSLQTNLEIRSNISSAAAGARRGPPTRVTPRIPSLVPLLAAVIFLTHPVNSEAVNWVSATPELLMTVFFLAALLFYLKYLRSLKSLKFLALSALFWFLALLSKETAVFLVAALPLLMLINANVKRMYANARMLTLYLLPLGLYLILRTIVLGRVVYKYEGYWVLSFGDQVLTGLSLLPRYLLKLVYPLPLSFQTQMAPVREVGEIWVIVGIGVIGVILVLGWLLWTRGQRLILFGLVWIILGFLPALVFVNKLGEFIFAERYLMFSTVGLGIVVVENTRILTNKIRIKTNRQSPAVLVESDSTAGLKSAVAWILVLAFVVYFVWAWRAVYMRAGDFRDNLASYQAMVRVNPKHVKAYYQLGEVYRSQGEIEKAKDQYQAALAVDPSFEQAKAGLALVSKKYEGRGIAFYYPDDWEVVEKKNLLILSDGEGKFVVEIEVDKVVVPFEEYLKSQKESFGKLVNEGAALIPGAEQAWVRVWKVVSGTTSEESEPFDKTQDKPTSEVKETKLQLFLFKGGKAVKVLVSEANSPNMRVFEGILGNIKIE